jgi:hypothetical protein
MSAIIRRRNSDSHDLFLFVVVRPDTFGGVVLIDALAGTMVLLDALAGNTLVGNMADAFAGDLVALDNLRFF